MEFWVIQTFNSISYAAIIFLLASGFSIIYGIMNIVNLAHASFYLIGGYVGLSVQLFTGIFTWPFYPGYLSLSDRYYDGAILSQAARRKTSEQVLVTIGIVSF